MYLDPVRTALENSRERHGVQQTASLSGLTDAPQQYFGAMYELVDVAPESAEAAVYADRDVELVSYFTECLEFEVGVETPLTDAQFREWLKRSDDCVLSKLHRRDTDVYTCCISEMRANENEGARRYLA
jgi:hypothetical protein